jgi:hypothetical protein
LRKIKHVRHRNAAKPQSWHEQVCRRFEKSAASQIAIIASAPEFRVAEAPAKEWGTISPDGLEIVNEEG